MALLPVRRSGLPLFHIVLIKPTHYDDDGYPIRWFRAAIPSNTLGALYSLADDVRRRQVLGPAVDIRLHAFDETNQRVQPARIIRKVRQSGGRALIGLVGVQSNQFPRALDLARPFRAAGLPVVIGGFHVSGCLAMLPQMPPEMVAAQALGISFFAGEAEGGRLDQVLRDAWNARLRPIYNHMDDLPGLEDEPLPLLPRRHVRRIAHSFSSFDLGRGCPYQCSFCTIINVQGRKSRFRTPDDLERAVRANWARGIRRFFITDDNLARNRNWEALFDRMIRLRRQDGIKLNLMIQVDTLCHRIAIIKRELPLDLLELFYLTPLPGSEDHRNLWQRGAWMDPDLNKYDLSHRVTHHARMTDAEWEEAYRAAWEVYYDDDHIRTILRRAAANPRGRPRTIVIALAWFKLAVLCEGVHPLESGAWRRRTRGERRPDLPREGMFGFHARRAAEIGDKARHYWAVWRRMQTILKEVLAAPDRWEYRDLAITPPAVDEFDNLGLYRLTSGGEAAVARKRRDDRARASVG